MSDFSKELDLDDSFYEGVGNTFPPTDVFAFSEVRSVRELAHWVSTKQIELEPDFQRSFIWDDYMQTRFIDSLLKQMPIPSMCITLNTDPNAKIKRIVVDGIQRISTIDRFINFSEHPNWKLAKNKPMNPTEIDERLVGRSPKDIKETIEHDGVYAGVENHMIQVTVIRANYANPGAMEYLYQIFQRINTGAVRASNQEIRNAIYSGSLNKQLISFVRSPEYMQYASLTKKKLEKDRMRQEERLLRVLSFADGRYEQYDGSLVTHLNDFMRNNQDNEALASEFGTAKKSIFTTINGFNNFERRSAIVFEIPFLVGCLHYQKYNENPISQEQLNRAIAMIESHDAFDEDKIREGTGAKDKLKDRFSAAISAFENV